LQLDGIVTLVDAYHIVGQLQHTEGGRPTNWP
jgi:hypothetical protein